MGILDHREQRLILRLAVDDPVGVKNLVAAMFAICLRKHHQLDVGRVALGAGERSQQIIDFVIRQGQAQFGIGLLQGAFAAGQQIDGGQRLGVQFAE